MNEHDHFANKLVKYWKDPIPFWVPFWVAFFPINSPGLAGPLTKDLKPNSFSTRFLEKSCPHRVPLPLAGFGWRVGKKKEDFTHTCPKPNFLKMLALAMNMFVYFYKTFKGSFHLPTWNEQVCRSKGSSLWDFPMSQSMDIFLVMEHQWREVGNQFPAFASNTTCPRASVLVLKRRFLRAQMKGWLARRS